MVLKEDLGAPNQQAPFIAVGDPSVADFFQVGPRQLRLIGKRLGSTDLSVTTSSGKTYAFELQVVADLDVLRIQLRQMFPEASLQLAQVRSKVVVEGQARRRHAGRPDHLDDRLVHPDGPDHPDQRAGGRRRPGRESGPEGGPPDPRSGHGTPGAGQPPATFTPTLGGTPVSGGGANGPSPVSPGAIASNSIATGQIQVINLIRVPTSQQVLLKVRVAELNRTAFRQIGADFLASIPGAASLFGSSIAGNGFTGAAGSTTFPYKVGTHRQRRVGQRPLRGLAGDVLRDVLRTGTS